MKTGVMVLGVMILSAVSAQAQVYDDRHDVMVNSMDRAIEQSDEDYKNVPIAGAAEDAKTQDVRYEGMTAPMNTANERHLDAGAVPTIREQEAIVNEKKN